MRIGVPKEIKIMENRVAMTPAGVEALIGRGHQVLVEYGAGIGSGLEDQCYLEAGARMASAEEAWGAELVIKVKEPTPEEYPYLRDDLILFTYLHLAADLELTKILLATQTTAIAYETVQNANGHLPLLTPMSEVAGRMATQVGAHYLEKHQGGRGMLLGGVPGVSPATVVILGGGVVGTNAAKIAMGMGARVIIMDLNHDRLQYLDDVFQGRMTTMSSNEANIRTYLKEADLLIGAVLIPGAKAPNLVSRDMLAFMKKGSVIVDVAVDQGGCVETIKPTTHAEPTYEVDDVLHYGVANMPGAVPHTSTFALVNQTVPFAMKLAECGIMALTEDKSLARGLNCYQGKLTYEAVGQAFDMEVTALEKMLP